MIGKRIIKRIEETKPEEKQFGSTFGFYQLFWIFMIGCFLGVVIEILFCLVKNGRYESRVGVVYGPFNPVYGFGALALTVGLYRLMDKDSGLIFIGGTIIGSVVEYICSWVQEKVVGTISWDYSAMPFNLHGRVNLLYSFFWGFLAILWVRFVYPKMVEWITRIPKKYGYVMTWIVIVFMAVNVTISGLAVTRWVEREHNVPTTSVIDHFFDERFPDERMRKIYPNMKTT